MTRLSVLALVAVLTLVAIACDSEQGGSSESPRPGAEASRSSTPSPRPRPEATETATPTPRPEATATSTSTPAPSPAAETPEAAVRFAAKGDFGTGSESQGAITSRMCQWREATGFAFVLTVGDNFYGPDGIATDHNYYDPERCLYSHPRHQWRAAWGNHDLGGTSTAEVLDAPMSPRYYSWTAGQAAFFAYDGNAVSAEQARWLREAVCSSDASVKIIYGHQPPFSVGPHGSSSDVREMVHPVARDCGASLVLSGHDHVYERTLPVEGVTYIVTGGGGASPYDCEGSGERVVVCLSRRHFLYVEADRNSIWVRAVDANGEILDEITIDL